ncbi:hypothetical protein PC116_g23203 [Phytophthora cactorum]|nr:hypothetical protein PC113_g19130 [Phytophthora cactorum]KAG2892981.1 hypothetical protein PC115_g18637 [Phytophthora cactorum]KAG2905627.1 hypothetical protein PC117_g20715 [Phytophthora cactorum]KAG3002060.1 hypothetical protein PC120_g19929 [Phytophthora cactorum]KAG3048139.1 hypothetical protein PC121_g19670 [Phytophthora cactorum]
MATATATPATVTTATRATLAMSLLHRVLVPNDGGEKISATVSTVATNTKPVEKDSKPESKAKSSKEEAQSDATEKSKGK